MQISTRRGFCGPQADDLLNTSLFDLRNRLVFHFDIDEIGRQIQRFNLSEPIFVSAMGQTNGQVYYELSDLCALRTFAGRSLPEDDTAEEVLGERLKIISNLITSFATAAKILVVTVLKAQGWQAVVIPDKA